MKCPVANNDNVKDGAIRFAVEPRCVPQVKAARRLHLTGAEFSAVLEALLNEGFPAPCPITGHFDLKAIDAWLDKRAGLQEMQAPPPANVVMEMLTAYG